MFLYMVLVIFIIIIIEYSYHEGPSTRPSKRTFTGDGGVIWETRWTGNVEIYRELELGFRRIQVIRISV